MNNQTKIVRKRFGGMHCVYKNCTNNYFGKKENIRFHRVPKDEARCRQWLQAAGRTDLLKPNFTSSKAYQNYRICSIHFERSMFVNPNERIRLISSAEPKGFIKTESPEIAGICSGHLSEDCCKDDCGKKIYNLSATNTVLRPEAVPNSHLPGEESSSCCIKIEEIDVGTEEKPDLLLDCMVKIENTGLGYEKTGHMTIKTEEIEVKVEEDTTLGDDYYQCPLPD